MPRKSQQVSTPVEKIENKSPLIFISHDTRDAKIAECFCNLINTISVGIIKCFRSSDKKGTQGIEYGTDWYPEIMKQLTDSTDVVCLLTKNSVNRPWILYEAGVAKGKLDKKVIGVTIGIPLTEGGKGPFAQFQNCDGNDEDELSKLIIELIKRGMPSSEPKFDNVKIQVKSFLAEIESIQKLTKDENKSPEIQEISVAKIYEEIKVMFDKLPERISPKPRKLYRSFRPIMIEEICRSGQDVKLAMKIYLSPLAEMLPWLYDACVEILDILDSRARIERLEELKRICYVMRREARDSISEEVYYELSRSDFWDQFERCLTCLERRAKERKDFDNIDEFRVFNDNNQRNIRKSNKIEKTSELE